MLLSQLLFRSSSALRDLHSFPTRRSSDLSVAISVRTGGTPIPDTTWSAFVPVAAPGTNRSEEHTSELQSRGHLVCRLLLEKKKSAESAHDADRKFLPCLTPLA